MPQGICKKPSKEEDMKRLFMPAILTATLLVACGAAEPPEPIPITMPPGLILPTETPAPQAGILKVRTLTVLAAASLTDAFSEIGQDFEAAHPGVKVAFNFAGSQILSTQLIQGAAADIFASANHTEMDKVVDAGLVQEEAVQDFLTNRLTVILPEDNPAGIQTLQELARPGLKLVMADSAVPAGKYARQALDIMSADISFGIDFKTKVLANVASNETDVKLVVAKVQLGEADAGIVYISDAVAATELKTISIPPEFNIIAKYPIAALSNAPQPGLASDFVTAVLSAQGQAILQKWGFTPINQ
jgi:molybdate transport system substrate-binding protein